jgi:hypothetical protein
VAGIDTEAEYMNYCVSSLMTGRNVHSVKLEEMGYTFDERDNGTAMEGIWLGRWLLC